MDIEPHVHTRLQAFADLVAASPHNLVSKRARTELMTRHVPECVSFAGQLPDGSYRLLDVGSGGGFPGLVLAIVRPELEVHLLDSTAKKTAFLVEAADALDVEVAVHTGRVEQLMRGELAGTFDVVTARALAPLDRLVGWTLPFLRVGGLLCAIKGERWDTELDAAQSELQRLGGRVAATPTPHGGAPDGSSPRVVMIEKYR
jgi:16S rRNA (guanine527-N7)-methyltransferase